MSSHRHRRSGPGVTLFPFLAVLICTMGALIALLVMVVEQARVQAKEIAREQQLAMPPPDVAEAEEEMWRGDLLYQQRDSLKQDLSDKRLELAHLEAHLRELQRTWETLQQQAESWDRARAEEGVSLAERRAELEELERRVEAASRALETVRADVEGRPPAYAIIPFDATSRTWRRPIYLECTARGVVLQPEGIVLTIDDFNGPLGPGNPLDAALRATREYLVHVAGAAGEPYPLLLVRPDGIDAYALARAAMRSWEEEFGYELVGEDLNLKFPEPDPQLARALRQSIADARSRQQFLSVALPSPRARRGSTGFVASPHHGGFVASSGGARPETSSGFGSGSDQRYRDGRTDAAADPIAGSGQQESQAEGPERRVGREQGVAGETQGALVPLAQQRGANWALPESTRNATAITRPVRIACLPDRLVILPASGTGDAPGVVMTPGPLADSADAFVSALWNHVDRWGVAVAGGYWQPVLRVEVAPAAEARYRELEVLLQNSGLPLERR